MEAVPADQRLVYRRTFTLAEDWLGGRLRINFQAVDYTAEVRAHQLSACFLPIILQVFINGQLAGRHTGGYDAFSFDITELLVEGEQEVVVEVEDPTERQVGVSGKVA